MATVFSIVIVLFGIIGFRSLGVREYPSVDPPIITVTTNYTGANADVIESQITEPLEESINGIAAIRTISSISSDGRSNITVEFTLEADLEDAANDVRDRVSRAVRNLPPDADPPVVVKSDADASTILSLTVQSDSRDLLQLTDLANNVFKERLQTIPGVSEIRIWGEKKYSMRLRMDPDKLAAYQLSPVDVRNALQRQNVELPSGRIEGYGTELTVRTLGRLVTTEDFDDMIVKETEGSIVKFRDVGTAELAPENERTILRGNGVIPMVGVAITPQPGSNYIAIADEFYRRVEKIKSEMPRDVELGIALDTTVNIRKAISEVQETILIAFGLVVVVIFVFLRDWRTTLIPVLAIPISLIGAFFIMYVAGFSVNILTLLGIVLATGLVVDDAIVVLENIYVKIEKGMNPKQAGHEGSQEIFFAVISTTVTLTAVFLPIVFLEGITGRLFREFGIVVAGSVIISSFVSLTLTPMMSARFLKKNEKPGKFYRVTERFFENMTNRYNGALNWFVGHRWVSVVIMVITSGLVFLVGSQLKSELAPLEDKSRLQIIATAPEGTSFEMMDSYINQINNIVDTMAVKESLLSVTAPSFGASASANSGFLRVTLVEPTERDETQQELADQMTQLLKGYTFARTFVVQEQTIGSSRGGGLPVQYVIQAPNFEKLTEAAPKFFERAQADPAFQVVDLNLKFNKPELRVEIDRDRARILGVSVIDIAQTLQLYFSGQRFGYFVLDGKQYQVIGEATRDNRNEPLDLRSLSVRNDRGELITLDNVVRLTDQSSPPQLYRYNRYVSATFSASPAKGVTLGQGIEAMDKIAAEVLDDTYTTDLAGTSKDFRESSGSLLFAFGLALLLVYLTLAAQFESFTDPLTIMFTVPLAIAGAVLSLWLTGQTLNIFSQIGIIVLIGLVTKNGILIVEFANQRKEEGLSKAEAVIDAATQRLRPILMTTVGSGSGALPFALALGAASKSRSPIGIVMIGGLLFSLILTLFVIPALYTYLSGEAKKEEPVEEKEPQLAEA